MLKIIIQPESSRTLGDHFIILGFFSRAAWPSARELLIKPLLYKNTNSIK